ncbi:hypothetical protein GDO81_024649 [Engystomops pustulosus]|uniref:Phospholipase A2 n=2 Tax=Engystomops pustulosus TaxID=76066 RepID=A0AAV6ZRN1_ENGPU|nr:hypothetical protein GDO81_024649 [Engystomops pustulosus]
MVVGAQATTLQFTEMINQMTKRSAVAYAFYGCHCGLGKKGVPLDAIDRCCHRQDCCYEELRQRGCFPITQTYKFSISLGTVVCDDTDLNGCARLTCLCDQRASLCFDQFDNYFSKSNSYNILRLNCRGNEPPCEL